MARRYGGIAWNRIPILLLHFFRYLIFSPLYLLARLYRRRVDSCQLPDQQLFILGHYRTGTSFLHRMLAQDSQFLFISNLDVVLPYSPRSLRPAFRIILNQVARVTNLKYSHLNNVHLKMEDPMEEDFALVYQMEPLTPYWLYVFPKSGEQIQHYFTFLDDEREREQWKNSYIRLLKRTTLNQNGTCLLLKNPPNTGRVSLLLSLFPNAKFIYLSRDPFDVFRSMKNMLTNNCRDYSLQNYRNIQQDAMIVRYYTDLVERYEVEKKLIPSDRLIEIKYEDLVSAPEQVLKQIYAKLDLGNFAEKRKYFTSFIKAQGSYKPTIRKTDAAEENAFHELLNKYHKQSSNLANEYKVESPTLDP